MADEDRAVTGRLQTWMWMVLALVVVAGFLTWLGLASEPSSIAIVETDEPEEEEAGEFVVVPKDTLAADKGRYEGQEVRVPSLEATGSLGPVVFWGELGTQQNQVPILIRMDSAVAAQGLEVETGSAYSVRGVVHRMSDSIAEVWGEQGVLADEGARMQATFADYFIEANNVRPARPAAGG
ncbi:MAG TPA: hypothetical protein VMM83_00470 [Longimicrobiales bacterium]|nr:hypothetical protein [Longimicrobiales bacterium]